MKSNRNLKKAAEIFQLRLKEYKAKAGLHQEGLAQAFNMTRQTMSGYENGRVPSLDMIVRLAELWDLSVSDLLKADETESLEEKRKRIFLQEIWEVCVKYFDGETDLPEEGSRTSTKK